MNVAFLGLGAIGTPMAARLAARARLTVWNRTPSRATEFAASHGAIAAPTPREAAIGADAVVTCLPTSAEVERILPGPDGLLAGMEPGSLLLDCTSGDPATSRRIASQLAQRGIAFADAPVSGGTDGAAAGTLTVMVGADLQTFERARPIPGPSGSGSSTWGRWVQETR
jgi:3-hydroxyisobutyrate dehydrogenase